MEPHSNSRLLLSNHTNATPAPTSAPAGSSTTPASSSTAGCTCPSPSPPSTATAVSITQVAVLSITAAEYTGNIKTLMETAYGIGIGIYEQTGGTWGYATGCSVSSSAARRSARVTFVATVSATKSAAA